MGTVCPLSSNCRWSGPHTCLCFTAAPQHCHSVNTMSKQCFCITGIHSLGLIRCETCGGSSEWSAVKTYSLIRVLGHQAESLNCAASIRPISEPAKLMWNVLLHCYGIGGLPFPTLLHTWLDLSRFFTSIVPPETLHVPPSELSLSLNVQVQHAAKKIPPTGGFLTNRWREKSST